MSWMRSSLVLRGSLSSCISITSSSAIRALPTPHAFQLTTRQLSTTPTHSKASTSTLKLRSPAATTQEPESSVARGTRYEHLCGAVLNSIFGMQLERTGGAGDRGVDLRGWWQPPSPSKRIRIVAQCKCQDGGGKKMGPVLIREMEGVVFRASSPIPQSSGEGDVDENAPLAGIVLSSSGFSKQALLQVRSSSVPLAAVHVVAQPQADSENAEAEDEASLVERCVSIVWNERFGSATNGLVEGGLEVRWVRSLTPRKAGVDGSSLDRPMIYRAGKPLKR